MKVEIVWDEKYPEMFLRFEGEGTDYARRQVEEHGTEVPPEMAERWRAVRDAWLSLHGEVKAYLGKGEDD